jgi:hypothetical protein
LIANLPSGRKIADKQILAESAAQETQNWNQQQRRDLAVTFTLRPTRSEEHTGVRGPWAGRCSVAWKTHAEESEVFTRGLRSRTKQWRKELNQVEHTGALTQEEVRERNNAALSKYKNMSKTVWPGFTAVQNEDFTEEEKHNWSSQEENQQRKNNRRPGLKLSAPSCRAEAINGKINRLDTRPQATKIRNPNVRTATKLRNKLRSETAKWKTENTNEIQTQIFPLRTSQDSYNHGGRRPPSINLIGMKTKTWLTSTLELANETGKWQSAPTL